MKPPLNFIIKQNAFNSYKNITMINYLMLKIKYYYNLTVTNAECRSYYLYEIVYRIKRL